MRRQEQQPSRHRPEIFSDEDEIDDDMDDIEQLTRQHCCDTGELSKEQFGMVVQDRQAPGECVTTPLMTPLTTPTSSGSKSPSPPNKSSSLSKMGIRESFQKAVSISKENVMHDPTDASMNVADLEKDDNSYGSYDEDTERLLEIYGYHQTSQKHIVTDDEGHRHSAVSLTNMTESIYSLMYVARIHLPSFFFAIFTFCFQAALIVLILVEMVETQDASNPLQIPPGVNVEVQIAAGLAMILAVATQEDMIVAVTKFIDGYKPTIRNKFQYATYPKWLFSIILQFSIGIFVLLDTFVIVMRSDTVISMMLNFAGLAFVSEIDDIAFDLAKHGFVTDSMQRMCQRIEKTPVPVEGAHNGIRRLTYLFITLMLFGFYGKFTYDQLSGRLVCQNIFVQFGDGYNPELPFFSGVYEIDVQERHARRPSYIEKKRGSCAIFAYCQIEEVWTFSFQANCDNEIDGQPMNHDPCDYVARSSRSNAYDILQTLSTPWFVRDILSSNIAFQFDMFHMTCNDCEVACSEDSGQCVDGQCVCGEDRYGLNCEFRTPCPTLDLDRRTLPFETLGLGKIELAADLKVMKDDNNQIVEVYNRPVYYSEEMYRDNQTVFTIVMFLGRRWVATFGNTFDVTSNSIGFNGFQDTVTRDYILNYMSTFHGYKADYKMLYLSEPMDVGTPSDSSSPERLQWYKAEYIVDLDTYKPDLSETVGTVLICSQCARWNVCANFGTCMQDKNGDKQCLCFKGFGGALCELEYSCLERPCLHGGKCNKLTGICQCPSDRTSGRLCQFKT